MSNNISISGLIGRAFSYSSTALLALISGLLLSKSGFKLEHLFLGLPFSFSIGFFVIYSYCFNYSKDDDSRNGRLSVAQKDALKLTIYFSVLLSIIFVLGYIALVFITNSKFITYLIIFPIIMFGLLYWLYGSFILRRFLRKETLTIRDQIFWPTIITIALSLFYSRYFEEFHTSIYPYIPIAFVLLFFFTSKHIISPKKFAITCLILFLGLIIVSIIFNTDFITGVLLCLGFSAYLGVFESWRITIYVREVGHNVNYKENINIKQEHYFPQWLKYYIGTQGALIISICCLPILFIYSNYGLIFFIGFSIHIIISFLIWNYLGRNEKSKQQFWEKLKSLMGYTFLIILILDMIIKSNSESGICVNLLVSFYTISILFLLSPIPVMLMIKDINRIKKINKYRKRWMFFNRPINFLRLLSLLSVISCCFIFYLQNNISTNSSIKYNSDWSFAFYSVIFVIYLYYEAKLFLKK